MLVGTNTVRQWILLVLLGDLGRVQPAVLSAGLVRAKLCETLARDKGVRGADSAFVVGLLSVCDALLDMPLDEIIPTPAADRRGPRRDRPSHAARSASCSRPRSPRTTARSCPIAWSLAR